MDQDVETPDTRSAQDARPVVVVGAGPTGLTAAMELSRMGVPVRLVDAAEGPSTTSRALAVQARTLELLDQRGLGRSMVEEGNPATSTAFYARGKRLTQVDLTRIPSRHAYILMLSQARTEALLRERVRAQGVTIEWGTALTAMAQLPHGGGVRAVLARPDGSLEQVEGSYLISAEGAHSVVRHTLDLAFAGKAMPQGYALADVHLTSELPDDEMSIFLASSGFLAVFPMGEGHYRFMATDPRGRGTDAPAPPLEELQESFDRVAQIDGRLHDMTWSSRFAINSRHLSRLRVGDVFLGGDAAHVHSPAGGQGMNTGIQDMVDLSWKLAAVLRGEAGEELLDTYQDDRLPIIEDLVATTERATDLFNSTNPLVNRVLTRALPLLLASGTVQDTGASVLGEVSSGYRRSPLAAARGRSRTVLAGLGGGDRLPDLDVRVDGGASRPLYGLLDLTRPTLVAVEPDGAVGGSADDGTGGDETGWQRVVAPWEGVTTTLRVGLDRSGEAAGLVDPDLLTTLGGGALLLVRPDAYVAAVASLDAPGAITAWLDTWLRVPGAAGAEAAPARGHHRARAAA